MQIESKIILMLYIHPSGDLSNMRMAIYQHLHVLDHSDTPHNIVYYNAWHDLQEPNYNNNYPAIPSELASQHFDLVILHTTFLCYRWTGFYFFEFKSRFAWIKLLACVKIALPQDEYDHAEILDEWLCDWGITSIFTICHKKNAQRLYPLMYRHAKIYEALTGYIAPANDVDAIKASCATAIGRPFDIVYRASRLPYWFGSHGQMKYEIADIVAMKAKAAGLIINISTRTEDAILGDKWIDFMASGRCTIGCESGSSVIDYRGEIQTRIRMLLSKNPSLTFAEVNEQMTPGWDSNLITMLSPRHFEAIATKTCQILVEGQYNGILQAGRHYISLNRDYSNLDDILEKIKDKQYTEEIAQTAYDEIFLSEKYRYKAFANEIEKAIKVDFQERRENLRDGYTSQSKNMDAAVQALQRNLIAAQHINQTAIAKLELEHQTAIAKLELEHQATIAYMSNSLRFLIKSLITVIGRKIGLFK